MRVKNTTTIPSETLREIIRFVCPPGVSGFDVRLNNCRGIFKGRAYAKGSAYHDRACPFVVLYIGADSWFPYTRRWQSPKGGYLPIPPLANRVEALVYIAAHELRHLWQERIPRGRRVWGARGQYSERDADAYALRMLRAWRRR
jgi:hypothetical protein